MKKALITGIAALLLATGTAHAASTFPTKYQGNWCAVEGEDDVYYSIANIDDCQYKYDGRLIITSDLWKAWEEECEPIKVIAEEHHHNITFPVKFLKKN